MFLDVPSVDAFLQKDGDAEPMHLNLLICGGPGEKVYVAKHIVVLFVLRPIRITKLLLEVVDGGGDVALGYVFGFAKEKLAVLFGI